MTNDNVDAPITRSSGDVFADLDIELGTDDFLKVEIARQMSRIMASRGYTQAEMAARMGTDQAKVSQIVRGRLAGLSIERLIRFLLALGVNVDLHLSEATKVPSKSDRGRVTVHAIPATGT